MLFVNYINFYFVNTTHIDSSNETIISNNSTYSTYTNGIDADDLFIDKNLTFAASIVTGINSIYNSQINLIFIKIWLKTILVQK